MGMIFKVWRQPDHDGWLHEMVDWIGRAGEERNET